MTLEEIKAELERVMHHGLVAVDCEFVLDMLNKLEPSWHPFPEEKPKKSGLYLTYYDGGFLIQRWLTYDGFEFKVDFWKEIDKPCKKEATND